MFKAVRKRLTILYIGLIMMSLLGFVAILYFGLFKVVLNEQEDEALQLAKNEAVIHQKWLQNNMLDKEEPKGEGRENSRLLNLSGNTFYFFISASGNAYNLNEPKNIQQQLIDAVSDWKNQQEDVITLYVHQDEVEYFVVAKYPLYDNGQHLGNVYAGKNITSYYYFFHRLGQTFVIMAFLFLLFAAYTGYMLAGKAMVPIQQAFIRQRQFVDNASHELRTPLSVIQASIEVLEKENLNTLSSFSTLVLDDLKDEVRRMSRLTDNLLTLARSDSNKLELIKEEFDFCIEARRIIHSFQLTAKLNEVKLKIQCPQSLTVFADRERLTQLLSILLDNAIKYNKSQGQVVVMAEMRKIDKSEGLFFSVNDTGIGIEEKHLEHLFKRFYRVDKMRLRGTGGFGLGLSIAESIVKAHSGRITIKSQWGQGTEIAVFIPWPH